MPKIFDTLRKKAFIGDAGFVALELLGSGGIDSSRYSKYKVGNVPQVTQLRNQGHALGQSSMQDIQDFMGTKTPKLSHTIKKHAFLIPDIASSYDPLYKMLASGEIEQDVTKLRNMIHPGLMDTEAVTKLKLGVSSALAKKLEPRPSLLRHLKKALPIAGVIGAVALGSAASDYMGSIKRAKIKTHVVNNLEQEGIPGSTASRAFDTLEQYAPDLAANEDVASQHLSQALKFDGVFNPAEITGMAEAQEKIKRGKEGSLTEALLSGIKALVSF